MRVLFWGTPEFATPALRALLGEGHDVVGVVTQPDAPDARHRSALQPPPVKRVADEEGIPVFQPQRPRGDDFLAALRELNADISVVIAYGQILGEDAIRLPPNGTLNIHASLLPRWRGAAPIQAALLAGDSESGVSVMRMVRKLDAGPVLLRLTTPIADDETHGELQLRLAELGALAIVEALALVEVQGAEESPQDESLATYAPKIARDVTLVNWTHSAAQISRVMRAFDPKPGAYTTKNGTEVKLFGARIVRGRHSGIPPGTVMEIDESGMLVACGEDALRIGYVFPAGRRRLAAMDWWQGRGVAVGDVFGA